MKYYNAYISIYMCCHLIYMFFFDFDNLAYIIQTDWKIIMAHGINWMTTYHNVACVTWEWFHGGKKSNDALTIFFEKYSIVIVLLISWLWNCVEFFATGASLRWEPLIHCGPTANVLNASDLSTWNRTYGHHHHLQPRLQLPMGL